MARRRVRRWDWRRRASPLVVFAFITAAAAGAALLLPADGLRPSPSVSFTLLDGRTLALAELRGKPVLVSFWATTCAPCIEELPDLIGLYRDLHPRGLELIAVAMPYDPPAYVQALAHEHDLPYPVALDIEGNALRAFEQVKFVPTAFLLNADGEMISRQVGKLNLERTRRLVEPFLKQS